MAFINFKDQWFQELRKVNWLVRECVEEKCRPFGITPEQGRVLNHLFLADGQVNLTQPEQESPCYKRKLLHVLPASGTGRSYYNGKE